MSFYYKLFAVFLVIATVVNILMHLFMWLNGIIEEPNSKYDIIIVGGGTAGCVLARRLSDSTSNSILVIEIGTTPPWISSVPVLAPALQGYADWCYTTVPQKTSHFGMKENKSAWPRGKCLGGTSVINYMLHMWGSRADYDDLWAQSVSHDWSFHSIRKYFIRSENYHGSNITDFRGLKGPLTVKEFDEDSPLSQAFLEGAKSLNIKEGDLNGLLENGIMLSQSNIHRGWRMSAYKAYLYPILGKKDLHILTNSRATKVVIEHEKAVGVTATNIYTGKEFFVRAKKHVLLTAGVIGSPQLLMLSGIGPKKHLHELGIPVIKDLPGVGENLRDHLNIPVYFHLNTPVSTTTAKLRSFEEISKFITKGKGPLSHGGVEVIARLPVPGENSTTNKMLFMLFNMGSINEPIFTNIANLRNDTFPGTDNDSKEGFIILASCTHPSSAGNVRLRSRNPADTPLINPKYLSQNEDVECLMKATKMAVTLGSTKPLRAMGARLHLPRYKECAKLSTTIYNPAYMECWIKMTAITAYHPLGTCSMGSADDRMAVVDSKLRVRGIKNLRVVDNSIFPQPTAGNPHATVLMVAEKAADIILKEEISTPQKRFELDGFCPYLG